MHELSFTTGQTAKKLGCRSWQVMRLFEQGILPEPPRVGIMRAIPESRLEEVRLALIAQGYLKEEAAAV